MSTRAAMRRGAVAGGGTIDDSDENGDAATAEDDGDERAPAPTEEEAEEDEDPAAAEDLSGEPKSVVLTKMECRVAMMAALANNNPVTAPYGECSKRCHSVVEELKLYRSPLFPCGMTVTLGTLKKEFETEHAAYIKRENGQQFTTGSHLAKSSADLDNARQGRDRIVDGKSAV
jgi:hypothetical protein